MFVIEENWIPYIDIAVLCIMIFFFVRGWKRGFLRMTVSLLATLASAYAAYVASPVLAKYIHLLPQDWAPMQDTLFARPVYLFLNQAVLFLAVFVILRILFIFIDQIFKGIQKIPVVKQLAEILGGMIGLLEGFIWTMILAMILCTPLFTNGALAVSQSFLGIMQKGGQQVISTLITPVIESENFSEIAANGSQITAEQQEFLDQWMQKNGYQAAE